MDKEKILKAALKRKHLAPNSRYLAGRYVKEYKNQPIYVITDKSGTPVDVIEGRDNAIMAVEASQKSSKLDDVFKKAKNKEKAKATENKVARESLLTEYKSSTDIQREAYDSAIDEYFKIDAKLKKGIEAAGDYVTDDELADLITSSPQLKNLQKNKIKAMKKVWALAQSGDEDYREETLDSFGKLPQEDYGKFTPSSAPGPRELTQYKSQFGEPLEAPKELLNNPDIDPSKIYEVKGKGHWQIEGKDKFGDPSWKKVETPQAPQKKKYSDEELLKIISGK